MRLFFCLRFVAASADRRRDSFDVACNGVDLDIDAMALRQFREIGDLKRMWNHVDLKARAGGDIFHGVHRETHATNRDRSFLRDEFA